MAVPEAGGDAPGHGAEDRGGARLDRAAVEHAGQARGREAHRQAQVRAVAGDVGVDGELEPHPPGLAQLRAQEERRARLDGRDAPAVDDVAGTQRASVRASPVGPDAAEQLVGPAAQRPRAERDVPAGVSPDPVDHRPQGVRVRRARLGGAPAVHRSPGALRVGRARERRVVDGDGLGAVAVARAPERRPHRGVVGRAPAGRRPDHREHVLLGAHELLGQRLDQRGDELPRERGERLHHPAGQRGRAGRHRHGERDRGALGQPGEAQVAADELEVAQDVGAADVETAVHLGRQVEGADEVVQDVGDRDRLGAVRQPRHGRAARARARRGSGSSRSSPSPSRPRSTPRARRSGPGRRGTRRPPRPAT